MSRRRHPRSPNRSLPPGLSRVDDDASRKHGYLVRLGWTKATKKGRHNKPVHKKYFGDATFGSARRALAAAVRWREERV